MSDLLISVITNGSFIAIAFFVLQHFLTKRLNKQEGEIQEQLTSLKSDLEVKSAAKQENIDNKRKVYLDIITYCMAFFDGRTDEQEAGIKKFVKSYDLALLWGSDEVVKGLTIFQEAFKMQGQLDPENKDAILTHLLSKAIIEMRKDLDFDNTQLKPEDITFVVYKNKQ